MHSYVMEYVVSLQLMNIFFSGLLPRLVGEAITIFLTNTLIHIINNFIIQQSELKSLKSYTSILSTVSISIFFSINVFPLCYFYETSLKYHELCLHVTYKMKKTKISNYLFKFLHLADVFSFCGKNTYWIEII